MSVPVTARLLLIKSFEIARIVYRTMQLVGQNDVVKHYAKVMVMKVLDHLFGIWKDMRVPCERPVFSVPSGWAEAGAEINQRVARQFLAAKHFCFVENFLSARQGAMRLQIAKAPQRWQFWIAGQACVLRHDGFGINRAYKEKIQWQCILRRSWPKLAFCSREIEFSERLVDEHRPAGSADDPRNRHPAAVRAQLVAALAAAHFVY